MDRGIKGTLNNVQCAIIEHIYVKLGRRKWTTSYGDFCYSIKCHDPLIIADALELLVEEDKIAIQKYNIHTDGMHSITDYKLGQDLNKFLSTGGNFCITLKPKAIKAYEELSGKQFRNLGSPAANQVVRDTITQLSPILTLDASRPEFASICICILEELVRIGVRNYQNRHYLCDIAQDYLKTHSDKNRRDCEIKFYQTFLYKALQYDELLARRIVMGAKLACGTTDILTNCQIPIEAKVIYPDDKREDSVLMTLGIGQAAQYASLSRVAFLSVLDLRPRNTIPGLSNIQNDVRVIPVLQKEGNHDVKVVRVQHICGYSAPCKVQ